MVEGHMLLCLTSQGFFSVNFLANLKLYNGRTSGIFFKSDVFWLCNICIIIRKTFGRIKQGFCKNGVEVL